MFREMRRYKQAVTAETCAEILCAKVGHKIDAIKDCDKVCFTTWNTGFQKENDWVWNVTSVIVFGRAELIEDAAQTSEKVRKLAMKYYPTEEEVDAEMEKAIACAAFGDAY